MNNLHVYFYMSRKRMNSKLEAPIYCRVALNQVVRKDFSTGVFLKLEEWDANRGFPRGNTKAASDRLTRIQGEVYKAVAQCERERKCHPEDVVNTYKQANENHVYTIANTMDELVNKEKIGKESARKLIIATNNFVELTRVARLDQVKPELLRGFECDLKQLYSATTVKKKLEYVKKLFTYAFNCGYITKHPFVGYKIPAAPKLDPVRLTAAELQQLEQKKFDCDRLEHIRDLFVFQCHTGLAYTDLTDFSSSSIATVAGRKVVKGVRAKSAQPYCVPLSKTAAAIADKYSYRLPLLTNQKYNAYLKEIADLCDITKRLTTHVGRKTFAQRMIDEGYSAESVSYMMGHANFNMTQKHYGRLSEERIMKEYLKIAA
jgi:integrase/recombinase XerD